MSRRAVVLAGGKGTRLRPYTIVLPKPLMPIGDFPILEVVIRQLASNGFRRITLAVNHQAELIQAFFGAGEKWGVEIDYSMEDKPLGTMGPLKLLTDLPKDFLVMNGDVLTDLDYGGLFKHHQQHQAIFTVSSHQRDMHTEYGVLEVDRSGLLTGFREKPVVQYEVSMGVYVASRKILDFIPKDEPYGFDKLMFDLMQANCPAHVKRHEGYWLDIGRPDDYSQAIEEFESKRHIFLKE